MHTYQQDHEQIKMPCKCDWIIYYVLIVYRPLCIPLKCFVWNQIAKLSLHYTLKCSIRIHLHWDRLQLSHWAFFCLFNRTFRIMNQRQFQHQLQTSYCSSVSENTLKFWNYGKLYSLSESKYLIKSKLNRIKSIKFKFEHLKLKLVQHLILVVMKIFVSVNENSLEGLGIYTTNPTDLALDWLLCVIHVLLLRMWKLPRVCRVCVHNSVSEHLCPTSSDTYDEESQAVQVNKWFWKVY